MTHDECVSMKRSDYSLCCNELGVCWDFYIKDGTHWMNLESPLFSFKKRGRLIHSIPSSTCIIITNTSNTVLKVCCCPWVSEAIGSRSLLWCPRYVRVRQWSMMMEMLWSSSHFFWKQKRGATCTSYACQRSPGLAEQLFLQLASAQRNLGCVPRSIQDKHGRNARAVFVGARHEKKEGGTADSYQCTASNRYTFAYTYRRGEGTRGCHGNSILCSFWFVRGWQGVYGMTLDW